MITPSSYARVSGSYAAPAAWANATLKTISSTTHAYPWKENGAGVGESRRIGN
jgi:hypothetical protein